jgi:hypothetical protein
MAALAAPLDPAVTVALVVEVAMGVTVARQDILLSLFHRGITICLTSEPLAAPVAVVAEELPVWVASVAWRERPAAAEPAATSLLAMDVMDQVDRLVIQADPDGTAQRETGDVGAIQVPSPSIYFSHKGAQKSSKIGRTGFELLCFFVASNERMGQRDRSDQAGRKCKGPLYERAGSIKDSAEKHHSAFPSILLIKGKEISNAQ